MPIVPPNWEGARERSATAAKTSPDVAAANLKLLLEGKGGEISVDIMGTLRFLDLVANDPKAFFGALKGSADKLIDYMVEFVTGFTITDGTVSTALSTGNRDATRLALGGIFQKLLDETLLTEDAAEGWVNRETGPAEAANTARLVGAAFRMQLGDMLADWIAKGIPFGIGDSLKDIAERVDKAINLDDAIEEIIQVPMQATITRGLEAYYNRKLKPADLSASEALKATISGKLSQENLTKILDNAGYRDDIRQILRDNAAGNLTESDLNDLYQWNIFTRDEVKKQYRDRAFEEPDAELKTKLVELTRRQKLREKVFELYGNLYRDGVATKQEVTPFLENYGYDADEVEMWFQVQELERRQRKWISDANVLKLIMANAMTFEEGYNYWVLQGMEANDASRLLSLAVKEEKEAEVKAIEREVKATIQKLPKAIKDKCDELLKPEDVLAELLAQLTTLIPGELLGFPGVAKLKNYIECVIKAIVTP